MKKNIIKFFVVLIIFSVSKYTVFAASGNIDVLPLENTQTIKELNDGINELNEDNKDLKFEFFLLNKDTKLKNFFNENLTTDEIKSIEKIVISYMETKNLIESELIKKAKNFDNTNEEKISLLNEKKDFYKNLLPYIRKDKIIEYLDYINQDVKILKEKNEVDEKIIIKKEIISNKVEIIEEKIKEHRQYLDEQFKKIVEVKVWEKIEKLKNSEKFIILSPEDKQLVLNKIIRKIKISNSKINSIQDKTDALLKKLEIYDIILEELEEFKSSIE